MFLSYQDKKSLSDFVSEAKFQTVPIVFFPCQTYKLPEVLLQFSNLLLDNDERMVAQYSFDKMWICCRQNRCRYENAFRCHSSIRREKKDPSQSYFWL